MTSSFQARGYRLSAADGEEERGKGGGGKLKVARREERHAGG